MIDGFSHEERVKLALLASFKNKSLLKYFSNETKWLHGKAFDNIQYLGESLNLSML